MTDAAARVLLEYGPDDLRRRWVPHLVSREPGQAWTAGQWMTEQQGGSDVGATTVVARREDGAWRLHGRKFFCSNVGGEMVLALARPQGGGAGTAGLGLFLIPRTLPDGTRNSYRIDRLKEKLGTRAMATGEVTLEGARAELVGELERGFGQMTPMLNITRFHNAVSSVAGMRRGLMLARGYAARRRAFGKLLEDQPLHRQLLDDLRVLGKPGIAEAYLAELERLEAPSRGRLASAIRGSAALDPASAQAGARKLAFRLAEAWIEGLLREAAARGPREARVAELWKNEDVIASRDLELVVDGSRSPQPVR